MQREELGVGAIAKERNKKRSEETMREKVNGSSE